MLVQLVMAAIATVPCVSGRVSPLFLIGPAGGQLVPFQAKALRPNRSAQCVAKGRFHITELMRSCGRIGPARLGTTVLRSSSSVSLKSGRACHRCGRCPAPLNTARPAQSVLHRARFGAISPALHHPPGRSPSSRRIQGPC